MFFKYFCFIVFILGSLSSISFGETPIKKSQFRGDLGSESQISSRLFLIDQFLIKELSMVSKEFETTQTIASSILTIKNFPLHFLWSRVKGFLLIDSFDHFDLFNANYSFEFTLGTHLSSPRLEYFQQDIQFWGWVNVGQDITKQWYFSSNLDFRPEKWISFQGEYLLHLKQNKHFLQGAIELFFNLIPELNLTCLLGYQIEGTQKFPSKIDKMNLMWKIGLEYSN